MRGVDARRTFLQYDCIFIEIALLGTHTGHTGHTGARGQTDHTDEPHMLTTIHPNANGKPKDTNPHENRDRLNSRKNSRKSGVDRSPRPLERWC